MCQSCLVEYSDNHIYSDDKQSRKWESCITIDRESWGYRRNAMVDDYYTIEGLIQLLAKTVR